MTAHIDTAKLAKVLAMLSSEHDGQVLSAARQATRIVRDAGKTWADILPKPAPPPGQTEAITGVDGAIWLPPIGRTWRETARWLASRQAGANADEGTLIIAVASGQALRPITDPGNITPERAETLTMIYRRTAGLPT